MKNGNRDLLYALSVLPPTIFLLTGHAALGCLFVACVVGGRFSRPAGRRRRKRVSKPSSS